MTCGSVSAPNWNLVGLAQRTLRVPSGKWERRSDQGCDWHKRLHFLFLWRKSQEDSGPVEIRTTHALPFQTDHRRIRRSPSTAWIKEWARASQRPKPYPLQRELSELLHLFAHGFHICFSAKTPQLHVVEEDPDDDKFIECAVALKADFVISGDKSLIAIEAYMGIRIVTPKQFLDSFM